MLSSRWACPEFRLGRLRSNPSETVCQPIEGGVTLTISQRKPIEIAGLPSGGKQTSVGAGFRQARVFSQVARSGADDAKRSFEDFASAGTSVAVVLSMDQTGGGRSASAAAAVAGCYRAGRRLAEWRAPSGTTQQVTWRGAAEKKRLAPPSTGPRFRAESAHEI